MLGCGIIEDNVEEMMWWEVSCGTDSMGLISIELGGIVNSFVSDGLSFRLKRYFKTSGRRPQNCITFERIGYGKLFFGGLLPIQALLSNRLSCLTGPPA